MLVQILILLFVLLLLPAYLLAVFWKGKSADKFQWLLKFLYTGSYMAFLFMAGRWDWVSYYLRYLMIGLYVLAAVASYQQVKSSPFFVTSGSQRWRSNTSPLLELLVGIGLLAFVLRGYFYSLEPVNLTFPLRDGSYYVGQGGNAISINAHNISQSQRYALDIVKLNVAGLRADGLYPRELERYEIYGEPIYSPCDGQALVVVDGFPDLLPPQSDPENPAGNHVMLACEDNANVILAHMQNGSVAVSEGEMVTTGQLLGLVGNSGNTSEPHLHIHAVKAGSTDIFEGEALPMLFDGKFPVRNTVLGR